MTQLSRYQTIGLAFLLVAFGFIAGYHSGDTSHPQPRPRHGPPEHRSLAHGRSTTPDDRMLQMHWSSEQPDTTIIVMQGGRPVAFEQSGPTALSNSPSPVREDHHGLLLALLALSAMPVAVWAALAWNRRRSNPTVFTEPEPTYQEFVPRRDD